MLEARQWQTVDEKLELDRNLYKLRTFSHSDEFEDLSPEEQGLVTRQLAVMISYSNILAARIALFKFTS